MRNLQISQLLDLVQKDNLEQLDAFIHDYMYHLTYQYKKMLPTEACRYLMSEYNYENRRLYKSCEALGLSVQTGDICYLDYGKAYINEAGFQHFGLIMNRCNSKAFLIPMTSNPKTYAQSYSTDTPEGKRHLYRLGDIPGLHKRSVLFLNDAKFVNTSRIIEVKGHIDPSSAMFHEIKERLKECLNL